MIKKINAGSFGEVYKVSEQYAVKMIPNKSYGIDCFLELVILCIFNYKYLLKCLDFFIDVKDKTIKILMPLADHDLYQYLKKYNQKKIFKENLKTLLWQITCGIAFLHSKNIIHGDIKPSNILIKNDGKQLNVMLGDFSYSSYSLNENHRIYNKDSYSYHYRPPEVTSGYGYTFKGDIWALGCTFYEIIYNENFTYNYKKIYNTQDKDLKQLLLHMLHPCESFRYNIWDVINSNYFKDLSKSDLDFELCYSETKSQNFMENLKSYIVEHNIPNYIYDILYMKLTNRKIEKSYNIHLKSENFNYEKCILEKIKTQKIAI